MKGMRWMLMIAAVGVGIAACGEDGGSGSCEDVTPSSCPSTQPTYESDVAPLLQKYCVSCHAPGGQEASLPLDTLAGVQARKGDVQSEVAGCDMPPSGEAQPTSAERETILAWLVCGASQ